ncbi:MAG: hypothetical protein NZ108_02895 [Bacteroidia bacterium]|nr:hypothetical protein [Bacteroidia bacterium]
MKTPFLNSTESLRKSFQEATELSTEAVNTLMETFNHQIQSSFEANRKFVELVSNQMQEMQKANLELWHKMTQMASRQMESATQVMNTVKEEAISFSPFKK